jgi:putative addiction module component (TIGR02574 family)
VGRLEGRAIRGTEPERRTGGRGWSGVETCPSAFCLEIMKSEGGGMSGLRNEIGSLSVAEKFELLDALWESLEGDELTLTEGQREELDYRVGLYERNPDEVIPWEQVRAGLFRKQ